MKHIFKALPTYEKTERIDLEKGIIYGVVLAQMGENKNGSYFSEVFLQEMEKQGNAKGEIKSRFGHPNMCTTALGTYIGDYKNFRVAKGKLYGDLHLSGISKKVNIPNGGISMYDYVMEMAQKHPEKFGNSIVVYANEQEEEITNEKGEKKRVFSLILDKWEFSDLVDDPAATDSLFHHTNDLGAKITEFLDDNPKIFSVLEEKPQIFVDFLQRYEHYFNRKNQSNIKMNLFKKVQDLLKGKEAFDVDVTLANGDIITIVTQGEQPQVGDEVKRKTDNAEEKEGTLEDGEYPTQEGEILVVVGGKITEIKPQQEQSPTPSQEQMEAIKKDFGQQMRKLTNDFETKIETLSKMVLQLNQRFETLAKGVNSHFQTQDPYPYSGGLPNPKQEPTLEEIKKREKTYKK